MNNPKVFPICAGKVPYETYANARRVAKRSKYRGIDIYHCAICGHWHLGNPDPITRKIRVTHRQDLRKRRERDEARAA